MPGECVPFRELFRKSAFVKTFKDATPIVLRNSGNSAFRSSHFGLKRDLPIPSESHRMVVIHNADESIGYTRFTDVTLQPGHRLIFSYLREKFMANDFAVKGRYLDFYGLGKRDIIIGLGGIKAILRHSSINAYLSKSGKSIKSIQDKVAANAEETFYLRKLVGHSELKPSTGKSNHLPSGILVEVTLEEQQ